MVCKVAEMLVERGQAQSAAAIMQRQARLFLSEGWLHLSSRTLKDLLDCHTLLYQVPDTLSKPRNSCQPYSFIHKLSQQGVLWISLNALTLVGAWRSIAIESLQLLQFSRPVKHIGSLPHNVGQTICLMLYLLAL